MRCTTATKTVTFDNTLKAMSFTFTLNINKITNLKEILQADYLTSLILLRIFDPKLFNKIKSLITRFVKMPHKRLRNPGFFLLCKTNLNGTVPIFARRLNL